MTPESFKRYKPITEHEIEIISFVHDQFLFHDTKRSSSFPLNHEILTRFCADWHRTKDLIEAAKLVMTARKRGFNINYAMGVLDKPLSAFKPKE